MSMFKKLGDVNFCEVLLKLSRLTLKKFIYRKSDINELSFCTYCWINVCPTECRQGEAEVRGKAHRSEEEEGPQRPLQGADTAG